MKQDKAVERRIKQLEYQTFNVDRLIKYFDGYKPKLIEFKKIEKLIIILEKVIEV